MSSTEDYSIDNDDVQSISTAISNDDDSIDTTDTTPLTNQLSMDEVARLREMLSAAADVQQAGSRMGRPRKYSPEEMRRKRNEYHRMWAQRRKEDYERLKQEAARSLLPNKVFKVCLEAHGEVREKYLHNADELAEQIRRLGDALVECGCLRDFSISCVSIGNRNSE